MIRERLRLFELKREAYLAEQLDLVRQMRGASNEERKRLREQLREQRQNWLDEAKQIREQARLRLQEMKQELANHSEVLEAARERAREQALEGAEKARERRGTD
jgi:vacuolar-type H+-ATPase subunit H